MIPQRVSIEGFLSYRDQVEFYFDGAPIWMLTGENGAGKSTVFDAITFALYGSHRGGKSDIEELINRNCDRLAVEFDFLLGDDRYRVRRTVARPTKAQRAGSTYQAMHLSGPNPPNHKRTGAQAIPGTDSKAGITQWVHRKLGLDEKAFKMSALLEQGKSDALLSAKPAERHELLSKLVDLSRYLALEDAAKQRRDAAKSTAQRNRDELATLPKVTTANLAAQEENAKAAKAEVEAAQRQLETLQALKVHARRWSELQSQQETTRKRHAQMQMLIAGAETIKRDAQRLDTLQKTLPLLRRIHQHSQSHTQHRHEAEQYRHQAEDFAALAERVRPLLDKAQDNLARLEQEKATAQSAEYRALQKRNELSGAIHELNEMERCAEAIRECEQALAQFAEDLDEQIAEAQRTVEELITLQTVLPHAQSYVRARQNWREAKTRLDEELGYQEADTRRVDDAIAQADAARVAVKEAREQLGHCQQQKAVAQHNLKGIREQIKRFEQVGAQPTCPYCGQPLSATHLTSERERLEVTLAEHTQEVEASTGAESAAALALQEAESAQQACDAARDAALTTQRERLARCDFLLKECQRQETDGLHALEVMRERDVSLFVLPDAAAIDLCFAQSEPLASDLEVLARRTQGYEMAQRTLRALTRDATTRDGHRTRRAHLEGQYQPLAERYADGCAKVIRTEYTTAEREQLAAQEQLADLSPRLAQADDEVKTLKDRFDEAEKGAQEARQKAHNAGVLASHEQQLVEAEIPALPVEWQPLARTADSAQLEQLQDEIITLDGAEARKYALVEAQSQLAHVGERLKEIDGELAAIPAAAQRPLAELLREEEAARACQAAAERRHQGAMNELLALQKHCRRIEELSAEMRLAEKRANHYGLIAKYLGRDYLQRFLLQQAERSIVERANEVLEQCSGGMLSMELRLHDGEGGVQKAFELMVENHATQSTQNKMLPAWLLSGSQRFRVAISMALAIGQYTSNNGQRIESVIIDEGFGSLDRQGLRDMEEALRDLSGMIKRIILVSHQDDFARAFPHRYAIQLKNGASHAELVDAMETA